MVQLFVPERFLKPCMYNEVAVSPRHGLREPPTYTYTTMQAQAQGKLQRLPRACPRHQQCRASGFCPFRMLDRGWFQIGRVSLTSPRATDKLRPHILLPTHSNFW